MKRLEAVRRILRNRDSPEPTEEGSSNCENASSTARVYESQSAFLRLRKGIRWGLGEALV